MVRFGNVFGSSGSVIQNLNHKLRLVALMVTHADITLFMSIPEAAHLVLNAGALAEGGEVFLLEMGEPVKIIDLAKSMIRQHGLQPVIAEDLRGRQKKDSELLIEFSGLRLGEKLYEELLVDGVSEQTKNPKIFKSKDQSITEEELTTSLLKLQNYLQENNVSAVLKLLKELPIGYTSANNSLITHTEHNNLEMEKGISRLDKSLNAKEPLY